MSGIEFSVADTKTEVAYLLINSGNTLVRSEKLDSKARMHLCWELLELISDLVPPEKSDEFLPCIAEAMEEFA